MHSGEGYIAVDGNEVTEQTSPAWLNGNTLVLGAASVHPNVGMHSVGPIIVYSCACLLRWV
jgi:hypothetical protein